MNIENITIVGARGRMGMLFADRARQVGCAVRGLDRPLTPEAVEKAVAGADMVLLSVPASAMAHVSELVARVMARPQILADVVSVKTRPLADMLAAYAGPVVGTHPLFGPDGGSDGFARVAVCPGRDDAAAQAVAAWFDRLGFTSFAATPEDHDRAVAHIQGLNFITTVSYLATLAHRPEFLDYLTPSFQRRLDAARKMLTQDAEMFTGLFDANPSAQEAVRLFRTMLNLAAAGDVDLLAQRALWWWRENNEGGSA